MLNLIRLLLPALIPSWRFFDEITASPRVEYRLNEEDWQEFRPRPARLPLWKMFARLFYNADWNECLYLVSLSERIAEAPTAHSHKEMSDRLRAELNRQRISDTIFQYRLVFVHRGDSAELVRQTLYESEQQHL